MENSLRVSFLMMWLSLVLPLMYLFELWEDGFDNTNWADWVRLSIFIIVPLITILAVLSVQKNHKPAIGYMTAAYIITFPVAIFQFVFGTSESVSVLWESLENACMDTSCDEGLRDGGTREIMFIAYHFLLISGYSVGIKSMIHSYQDCDEDTVSNSDFFQVQTGKYEVNQQGLVVAMDHSTRNRTNIDLSYTRAHGDYSTDQISILNKKAIKEADAEMRLFRRNKSNSDNTDTPDQSKRKESAATGRKNQPDSPGRDTNAVTSPENKRESPVDIQAAVNAYEPPPAAKTEKLNPEAARKKMEEDKKKEAEAKKKEAARKQTEKLKKQLAEKRAARQAGNLFLQSESPDLRSSPEPQGDHPYKVNISQPANLGTKGYGQSGGKNYVSYNTRY